MDRGRALTTAALTATWSVLALTALVNFLWASNDTSAHEWLTHFMKGNSAAGLGLAAISILLHGRERPRGLRASLARLCAFGCCLIGALTLMEYLTGLDLGIDLALGKDVYRPEVRFPGRIAPNTATSLFALGAALVWRDYLTRRQRAPSESGLVLVLIIAGTAIIGHAYGANTLFQIPSFITMSLPTASSLAALSLAALLRRPEYPTMRLFLSAGPDGSLLRRLLPFAIAVPIFVCWGAQWLRDHEYINRPTGYALIAVALVTMFTYLIWMSARALGRNEARRVSGLKTERDTLAIINRVGATLTAELDQEKLVQAVTDAATRLSGAQFGAFFYNVHDAEVGRYTLYTISGVPRAQFEKFPMPRATEIFRPTFEGSGTVRSDDILADPRYGQMSPYHGMPAGHLPVRSYLAVPVVSRAGQTLGGLFFGHAQPAMFTEQAEKLVEGLASTAAIAMDNARLYQEVQKGVRIRDEFMSMISHELKTPITSMVLQQGLRRRQLAKARPFDDAQIAKMVETDERQIGRLTRLIDEMLDISRIGMGKFGVSKERVDLAAVIAEVVERFQPQLRESSGLDPLVLIEAPLWVEGDAFRLEQVLVNLLTNAMKYGGGKLVELTARHDADRVTVKVKDQGMGIRMEDQERIFNRFERAVKSHDVSGLGLGLAIVKEIVTAHDGTIAVQSELGLGSTFTVTLPGAHA